VKFPITILLGISPLLAAFTPTLTRLEPAGGQRGTELEIHFYGERLSGIDKPLFYQSGLTLSTIEIKDAQHAVAKLSIAPDAPLGEHALRLTGPGGLTELGTFWVGQFPNVSEIEPNATFENAQRVELNSTVLGIAENEDEDYFVCTLQKGQRLSVELEAMRLGRTFFDATLHVLDPQKNELALCDDSPLLRNDPWISLIAPVAGDYRILVHAAAYEGSKQCHYRLHLGTFPRPTAVFPSGGKPGETINFTFLGDPTGPFQQTFTLPLEPTASYPVFPIIDGLSAPSPLYLRVSPLESNSVTAATSIGQLSSASPTPPIPCAVHSTLEQKNTSQWFSFTATKDQNLRLRVVARALRSPLDSILSLHLPDGKSLAFNDDQGSPDSLINWTCPADGTYFLQIRDQLKRGGPDFSYRLEIDLKSPALSANLPTVERIKSQLDKTFPIPLGNRYATVIQLTRENTNCAALFQASDLPAGVTLHSPAIPNSITSFPIVLEASADAPLGASLHAFSLHSSGISPELSGSLIDTIHLVDVNNEGAYHSVRLDRIATAVTRPAPFHVDLIPPSVPIVKNGTLPLQVHVTRDPGFTEKITVRFLWSPPGISGPVSLDLPPEQSDLAYELNASADAAPADWQVCVLAEANTPEGPVVVSSALCPLKVAEPYLTMNLDIAATEQGKVAAMLAKIEIARPFPSPASVELMGLPAGVTCPPQNLTHEQTELTFPLAVAADAKIGKFSGIFCRVLVPENGSQVLHHTALNSTLRIDAASSAPTPEKPIAPQATTTNPAKPLSRLEQLRQQSKVN
jgi:hypothetical protein